MAVHARNILSLCAGVGGLELGILLALNHRGETGRGICYVEREAAAAACLVASMEAGWFHPAPVWSDMLTFDARPWRGVVHILASGDPCQDNSVAGKRAGAGGKRFLAPQVCRLAEECRPDLIFRENVTGNIDGQLEAIVPPLEGLGYRLAAGIFSSAKTGNTMRRERLFIMAERQGGTRRLHTRSRRSDFAAPDAGGLGSAVGNTRSPRSLPGAQGGIHREKAFGGAWDAQSERQGGDVGFPTSPESQGQRIGMPQPERRKTTGRYFVLPSGAILPPAVIPGPTDSRWIDVLDRWPELQPALSQEEAQSHLRRGIDALAHRIERLRATGNGVDPIVAADAFLSLQETLSK